MSTPLIIKSSKTSNKAVNYLNPDKVNGVALPSFTLASPKGVKQLVLIKTENFKDNFKGNAVQFTLKDNSTLIMLKTKLPQGESDVYIPIESIKNALVNKAKENKIKEEEKVSQEVSSTEKTENTDTKETKVEDKLVADVPSSIASAKSIAIGSSAGAILGIILKNSFPCCGNNVIIGGVIIGGLVGYLFNGSNNVKK